MLEPVTRDGALPMALHPVMTFTGRPDDLDRLDGICFGVTAPEPLRPAAEALVIEMGGEPVIIDEEVRGLYHAGLASAAKHLVALVAQSGDVLRAAGVPSRPGCSGRCCPPPWITPSGSVTPGSPGRWPAVTRTP